MRLIPFALVLCALAPCGARAQATDPPKPDFSRFAFMKGSWTCTITSAPNPKMVGQSATLAISADPNGYQYLLHGPSSTRYLSYDVKTARWFSTGITAHGESSADTSPGWSGNTIVFSDAFNSDGSKLGTTTITKASDRSMTIVGTDSSAGGDIAQSCAAN